MPRLPFKIAITQTLLLATLWLATSAAHQAHAATTDTVTDCSAESHNGNKTGTLRYKVEHASPGDTITFSCSGTIVMSGIGNIPLPMSLTIDGGTQAVTLGGGVCTLGVFEVENNASIDLRNLTIANCNTSQTNENAAVTVDNGSTLTVSNSTFSGNSGNAPIHFLAGAIDNLGTLSVTNSTFSGNSGARGGAIYNIGALSVTNSTFNGNSAGFSGGAIENSGTATITNSIFSGNVAGNIFGDGGGIESNGTLTVTNSIFSGNNVTEGGGGGLANSGTATITNSILSGNNLDEVFTCGKTLCAFGTGILTGQTVDDPPNPIRLSAVGTTTLINTELLNNTTSSEIGIANDAARECFGHKPHNTGTRADDKTCSGTATAGLTSISLNLGPLTDNGGPTQTIALGPGSAAIGTASCLQSTDQRGFLRPGVGKTKCDSGAYESGANAGSGLGLSGLPANMTVNATSASGAAVAYTPPTATNAAGAVEVGAAVSCTPQSGTTFAIGTTTVTCSATDTYYTNSPLSKTFTVTVKDASLVLKGLPTNITANATSASGAVVTYTPPTATNLAGNSVVATVSCAPKSGSTFTIATTSVTCAATASGYTNSPLSKTFTLTVKDATLVMKDLPANIITNATSAAGAVIAYTPPSAINLEGTAVVATIACTPKPSSTFAIGTTTVTCTATASGYANSPLSKSFTVTVKDATLVMKGLPTNITTNASSAAGAAVTYTRPTATNLEGTAVTATIACAPKSGATFAIATTTVTCSATASGYTNSTLSKSFTVMVKDATLVLKGLPANITANATSASGAAVTYTPPTATNLEGTAVAATIACTPKSGSTFAIGATTVTCAATASGYANSPLSKIFTITVKDATLVMTGLPTNIITNATSASGAIVTYTPPTATNLEGTAVAATISCDHDSGTTFPIGTTTVTCTATTSGYANSPLSASFTVTVKDATLVLSGMPANITVNATSAAGAVVTYTPPTATNLEATAVAATIACTPQSGATFPIGTTTVTCAATAGGYTNSPLSASFTVTVNDTTLALAGMPANIAADATSAAGAVVTYTAPTATNLEGAAVAATISCDHDSGTTFPIGATTVTCTAAASGYANSPVSASFAVTVDDTTLALAGVPANISTDATSASGAVVTYTAPTAANLEGAAVAATIACTPATGSTFPIGTTTVTCTATASGYTNSPVSGTFAVAVNGSGLALSGMPADITADASSAAGAAVTYTPPTAIASDGSPVAAAISCDHDSGSTFPIGATTVTCTATDAGYTNSPASATFTVTVDDTTLVPADFTVGDQTANGTEVSYTAPTATNLEGKPVAATIACDPASGSLFPNGTTTVTCTATADGYINSPVSATFLVTVQEVG